MKKITTICIISLLLLISGAGYFINSKLPNITKQQTLLMLNNIGFERVILSNFEFRINTARFKNIALDPENFSTIEKLEIKYSPISLLFKKQLNSITITGLNLTGELLKNGDILIAGWNVDKIHPHLQNKNLKTINIQNSQISLLTENHGGIAINYDLQTRTQEKQTEFQAHISTQQKQISFIANAKGYINANGTWQTDIAIEEGKFKFPLIKASRINGWINILDTKQSQPRIISELRAGGSTIYGLPWQNLSATIEGTQRRYQIFSNMKSTGFKGIELNLNLQHQDEQTKISGQLYTEKFETLTSYLKLINLKPFTDKHKKQLTKLTDVNIAFKIQKPDIIFYVKDTAQNININGKFNINAKN